MVRAWSGLIVIVLVWVCFMLVSVYLSHSSCFQNGTSGNSSLLLSSSSGLLAWIFFSAIFFGLFPLPVLDFLGGGTSRSDSSLGCDLSSLCLDLLWGWPAILSYCQCPCQCSFTPDIAHWTMLYDRPHFSATVWMLPTLLIVLSPTTIMTNMLW